MSIPYIPLYVADYEADTAHLSIEEDGAYMRLLRLCWRTPGCSIPDDAAWIMRRMRCTADEFHRVVAPLIAEFFRKERGRIYNQRLSQEFRRIEELSQRRSEAGKKGGRPAKALNDNDLDESKAKAKQKHLKPEPEPELEEKEANASLSPDGDASAPKPLDEIAEAVSAYNLAAEESGWPKVAVLSKARRSALSSRLRECGGLAGWSAALARAQASPHLCGQNDRGWVASFDFLTRQSSFAKLMEGNYDERNRKPGMGQAGKGDTRRSTLEAGFLAAARTRMARG